MGRTHLVFNDRHCAPGESFEFCDLIGKLICDLRPDVVIDNGDGFDMPSLSSYDRNTKSFHGRTYKADINAGIEGNDRIWSPIRKLKKKLPYRVVTIGNHEQRINKAINMQSELDGTIGLHDLNLDDYYQDIVYYNGSTPGIIEIDGVYYAHYLVSGVKGLPISGVHPAHALVYKTNASCTVGHLHTWDAARLTGIDGRTRRGLVNGCATLMQPSFAGHSADLWSRNVAIKHNVEDGNYDLEVVSYERLKAIYG